MAIATSIDAAAAGVTLPLLDHPVLFACAIIGMVTLILSTAGVLIGAVAGTRIGIVPNWWVDWFSSGSEQRS
ncbi:MAG: manganese efflux pump [Casimicrobiaceae bacterium]